MKSGRFLSLLLAVTLLAGLAGLARPVAAGSISGSCLAMSYYSGQMIGTGNMIDAHDATGPDMDHIETWTEQDYEQQIAFYDTILATIRGITPPPAAAEFHQTFIDGIALFQEMLTTMKEDGPFAVLAYMQPIADVDTKIGEQALPLEQQCGIALWDNDGDGEPEVGPGLAAPESDGGAAAEATPIGFASDGRPIMPIGTTVQTSDAFALTVVSVDQNAVDAVPEAPPDGYQYVNVEMTLSHLRDQTDTFDLISLVAVGGNGPVYSAVGNSCGVVDGPLAPGDYSGTLDMTGHVCFVVASRDVDGLILYDQTQPPDERVYLSLDPAVSPVSGMQTRDAN